MGLGRRCVPTTLAAESNGLIMLGNTVTVPDDKKADVLKLAEKLKDDADMGTRQQAVFVLAKYATKDQVPALMKLMEGKADGQRAEVIVALGRLKEEKAAPLIVKCLGEADGTHRRRQGADGHRLRQREAAA